MKMVYMSVVPTFAKRSVSRLSTLRHLPQRQTENEIVESIPSTHENLDSSRLPRRRTPIQTVIERSSIPIRGAVYSSIPECELMFRIPNHHEPMFRPLNPVTRDRSVQKLGENFVHIMESFKRRGSKRGFNSREPLLGMHQYRHRLDHRFVSSVLEMKVDIDAKITFFSWSGQTRRDYQHNYSTYSAFIQVLEEEARLATRLSDWVYPFLLGLYLKLFKVEKALLLLEEMEQTPGSSPTYYSDYMELIKEFVRVGKVEEAYSLHRNVFRGGYLSPDILFLKKLMNILSKIGRVEVLTKLVGVWTDTPRVNSYNALIRTLFESKAPDSEVTYLLDEMKADGVSPDGLTYAILINGYCERNRVEKALLLLEEMDEEDLTTFPLVCYRFMTSIRYDAGNELSKEEEENFGRVYAIVIKHFGKRGKLMDLFNEMTKVDIIESSIRKAVSNFDQNLLQQVQSRFQTMLDSFITKIDDDDMRSRIKQSIDDLRVQGPPPPTRVQGPPPPPKTDKREDARDKEAESRNVQVTCEEA